MDTSTIIALIVKRLRHEISEKEERAFQIWINAEPSNASLYKKLKEEYENKNACQEYREFESLKDWNRLIGKIKKKRKIRYAGIVAVSALLIASPFIFLKFVKYRFPEENAICNLSRSNVVLILSEGDTLNLSGNEKSDIQKIPLIKNTGNSGEYIGDTNCRTLRYDILETKARGIYAFGLRDGSKITLNSDSRLKLPKNFIGNTREVYLEGEAYFEIASDPARPFVIHCRDYRIIVKGTAFNVSSYPDDNYSVTTLAEGSIDIVCKNEIFHLNPGHAFSFGESGTEIRTVDPLCHIAWKDNKFCFDKEDMASIMKKISRWYGINFIFKNPKIEFLVFSGYISRYENPEKVFQVIEDVAGVRISESKKGNFIIESKSEQIIKP